MAFDDEALLQALASGQVSHAVLDVFRTEPLPVEHPFWSLENVTVTPHIASETRPVSASESIAENIWRGENGQDFLHLVIVDDCSNWWWLFRPSLYLYCLATSI